MDANSMLPRFFCPNSMASYKKILFFHFYHDGAYHGLRLCKKLRMQGAQAGKGRGVLFVR